MKKFILLVVGVFFTLTTYAQIGSIKAETYVSEFEKKQSIEDVSDYNGPQIPIALLNVGISDEVYDLGACAFTKTVTLMNRMKIISFFIMIFKFLV